MILVIKEKHRADYRLASYQDFYETLPEHTECCFYGLDSPNYDPRKTFGDIMKECPKEPSVVFVMAPLFKHSLSLATNTNIEKYLLITDSFDTYERMQKKKHYPHMEEIAWQGIFHHYLHCLDFMKKSFYPTKWHYWPNWAAKCYDYEKIKLKKDIDFFLSGAYSHEYEMRKRFHKAFHKSDLNFIDQFQKVRTNSFEDNERFRSRLLRSMYSPCDGGVNGRVVPRYVESGYAKSVVITPDLGKEMKILGFEHGKNCITLSRNLNKKQILKFIKAVPNHYNWTELAENAYKLVKERHTTECRVKEFLEVL
jgi:hypothetical protein